MCAIDRATHASWLIRHSGWTILCIMVRITSCIMSCIIFAYRLPYFSLTCYENLDLGFGGKSASRKVPALRAPLQPTRHCVRVQRFLALRLSHWQRMFGGGGWVNNTAKLKQPIQYTSRYTLLSLRVTSDARLTCTRTTRRVEVNRPNKVPKGWLLVHVLHDRIHNPEPTILSSRSAHWQLLGSYLAANSWQRHPLEIVPRA